jgi:hypothetical protein
VTVECRPPRGGRDYKENNTDGLSTGNNQTRQLYKK